MVDLTCFNWIQLIKKSALPANAKYLALYLATFMNDEHDIAWPSMKRISHETGMGENTCRKWLDYLDEQRWLIRTRNAHPVKTTGGVQMHNEYTIGVPANVLEAIRGVISRGGSLNEGPHLVSKGGSSVDVKGGQQMTPNNNMNNNRSNKKAKALISADYRPSDRCYELIGKAGISKAFADSLLEAFIFYWQEREEKRPGWDSTFLNHVKARWKDEKPTTTYGAGAI